MVIQYDCEILIDVLCSDKTKRLGAHAWLMICNIMTETIICLKFSENEFPVPAPFVVKAGWSIVLLFILIIFPAWRFLINPAPPAGAANGVKKD